MSNDWFVQQLANLADQIGYQEEPDTAHARERLEQRLPRLASLEIDPYADREFQGQLESYNDGPEFNSSDAESPHEAVTIWAGSRLMLARAYLMSSLYTQAADAMEDAIGYLESHPEAWFDVDYLSIFKQIKSDLREWAGVPGLI